jgi:hypothetical protein
MRDEALAGLDALIQDAKPEERAALVAALAALVVRRRDRDFAHIVSLPI